MSTPIPSLTVSQQLAHSLSAHTHQAFGVMGNGNAHLIDAFAGAGITFVEVRHEAGAVAAADAFTRVSQHLAIATATYGAGFTNTVTALAEAAMAHTPMVVVVGDTPTGGPRPWDVDQAAIAAAVGVQTVVLSADAVAQQVNEAVALAHETRRPVVIGLPYDLAAASAMPAAAPTTVSPIATATTVAATAGIEASERDITAAVELLAQAERPVIIAGHGAHLSGAAGELGEIARRVGALTGSTARARGIFPEPEFDLGVVGGFGVEPAMELIATADVVVVVGAGLNQFTLRFGALFAEGTTLIRVDSQPLEAPSVHAQVNHLLLQGDARNILHMLNEKLASARPLAGDWRHQFASELQEDGEFRTHNDGLRDHPDGICADGLLDPRAVAARIAELLPGDRHVTSDGGHFIGWANMFWPVASPERMTMVGTAYQTIGLGLPALVGVAAAAPDSTAVLTTGDGGALMALADFESAIRTARSAVIVIWNDGAYGAEVHLYGLMGLAEAPMLIPHVDFAGIATALGARGVRVEQLSDLDALGEWGAAGATGTLVLDCRISRSVVAPYQREVQQFNGLQVD